MFKNLSALFLLISAISALQLDQPTGPVYSSSPITISWSTSSGDPATFDLYVTNPTFHNTFAIKNRVTTSDGNITVGLPVVPAGPGYTFQASPVGDVTTALSQTSTFDILDALSSSSTLSSTSSGTGTISGSSSLSTSSSSSTVSKSTPTGTSTSSSSTIVPSGSFNGGNNNGNNGALGVTGIGSTFVGVLVAAGAFLGL